jgi:hypothetical protein
VRAAPVEDAAADAAAGAVAASDADVPGADDATDADTAAADAPTTAATDADGGAAEVRTVHARTHVSARLCRGAWFRR